MKRNGRIWAILMSYLIGALFIGVLITILSYFLFFHKDMKIENFNKGYGQGQIDALNGIQYYNKIVTKPDTVIIKIK